MDSINSFRAVYCSGLFLPNQSTLSALCLLFEKVYLPNDIDSVVAFSKRYRVDVNSDEYKSMVLTPDSPSVENPLDKLTDRQRETFFKCLSICSDIACRNSSLFDNVIETNYFPGGKPFDVKIKKVGAPGELNTYTVRKNDIELTSEADSSLSSLINKGYIPVVGGSFAGDVGRSPRVEGAKQLAALLAVKSVEMFFPQAVAAKDEDILEARHKLRDHLPLFWSSMFKLSVDMKKAIDGCDDHREVLRIGEDIVDTTVRPALTELNRKIELERQQWFFRVFGQAYKALKIAASSPNLSPEQVIKGAMMFSADTLVDFVGQKQKIENLKDEGGLTYLLELGSILGRR